MAYYRDDSRYSETDTYSNDNYRRGGGYGNSDDRFTETPTTTYTDDRYGAGGLPPPPSNIPRPWFAEWDQRERRYIFVNDRTGERQLDFPREQGYYSSETTTTYYDEDGTRNYGNRQGEERKHGHGLAYGALGAAAGLAGGALLMHEGSEIRDDYERDKYRVEQNVEDFPHDAARWTGRKVGEIEDIPHDVEQGFDRFGNRIEQGFDNTVDDVVDAPDNMARWAGRKVGDVERFDDNVDNAYDQGKYEGRNDW